MKRIVASVIFLIFTAALIAVTPSPVWEDQVVYFLMTDRFANGDSSNDELGFGESGVDNAHYNGGDLAGLIDKLDYVKGLGATAIWLTPPVANQWWNPWVNYGGYHGYWARDFKKIDEHFGTNELYAEFVEAAHKKGLYIIQDIVPNHVGDYFRFVDGNFYLNTESVPTSSPSQPPFSLNNYETHGENNIYHWTPDITDFADEFQKYNYQMSGLDDLNTENPEGVASLKDSYGYWIKEADIDGFRIDTVIYVPHEFWKDFLNGENGIYETALAEGKDDFMTFGEAWVKSDPGDDTGERVIGEYFEDGMSGMLDFPLNIELRRVFKEGKATANLTYRLERREAYEHPERLFTFIDNHDMERFLKGASMASLKQALSLIFTIPGIPVVYYGTEQGFTETRAAMFKGGFESNDEDHYDTNNDLYRVVQELTALRKEYPVFRYGKVTPLKDDPNGPGVFAFKIEYDGAEAYVMMNTSIERKIITNLKTGLEAGTVIKPIFTVASLSKDFTVEDDGQLVVTMNPKSVYVGLASDERKSFKTYDLEITPFLENGQKITGNINISGVSKNVNSLKIIFDNRIDAAVSVDVVGDTWSYDWDISKFDPGVHTITFKIYGAKKTESSYSEDYRVLLDIPEVELATVEDPEGDDRGPDGNYLYPTDITFKRQMDLLGATAKQVGASLVVSVNTKDLTNSWGPQNGFDHVTFQIFIDDPEKTGSKELPYLDAKMPDEMDWDYLIFANGWSIVAYSSQGAGAESWGNPIAPTPMVVIDQMKNEVTLIMPGELFDRPSSYSGYKLYITTWDFDGIEARYRDLKPEPKAYIFGGGNPGDPKIMDDISLDIE